MLQTSLFTRMKRPLAFLLCLILAAFALLPNTLNVHAEEDDTKTIRVGWHEEPYFITDEYGRKSGYSYDYQSKVAAYTGWDYEYVEGTWSDLLQMLKDGEIDLMTNVSYTDERADSMLYSSLPMGTESYYIYVSPDNKEITSENFTSLNGKRVGVTKDSIQKDLFLKWAEQHGIETELIEMNCSDEESLSQLGTTFDAFVSVDVYGDPEKAVPVSKIGSSDFYFVTSNDRQDLLVELDAALNRIQDENPYFNEQLHEQYLSNGNAENYLTPAEKEWLTDHHNTIRVGYQDNYLAFCASDPNTGELTGALKDYLEYASTSLENANINFEAISYPTASAALEALNKGEIDCMFPANLTNNDSEELGVVMSPPLMRTEMDAVVRASGQKEFVIKPDVTVAVNEGNTNYDMWLSDNFPTWNRAYFVDTPTGLEAVANGEADCVIISNYRFSNISKQCEKLRLATVYTGVDMDYCFAVNKGDTELYSILSRVVKSVPDAVVHTALTYYSTEDVKTSFGDLLRDNLFIVLAVIAAVMLVILILLLRNIRAEKKVLEEERLVKDLNKRAFVDALTSVRNKGAYFDYIQELQNQLEEDKEKQFAVGVFDCDNLKYINDRYGHDKGDEYLKTACRLICHTFQHSPVFRIGGDEFTVILEGQDYENRDALVQQFEESKEEISATADDQWKEVHIAIGIAEFDPALDQTVYDTTRRADKIMYENKRLGKMRRDLD